MFVEERHQAILKILQREGSITNVRIQEEFGISYDSAKRDLRILEEKGQLKRTHGGAIPTRQVALGKPEKFMNRDMAAVQENYLAIARYAVTLIQDNDTVYISAASVGYFMAKNLPDHIRIRAIVNSIEIAELLRPLDNVRVILLGGEMDGKGMCRDSFTVEMIQRLRFDKAFITSAAVSAEFGLSIQNSINLSFLHAIMKQARQVIGLFPVEKIGFESVVSICPVSCLDLLVTDWNVSEEEMKKFREAGVSVRKVERPGKDDV